jgi:hypothetical protein
MKRPTLTHLLVSVPLLLLCFSDGWAAQDEPVEIESVLNLFKGDPSTWPVQQGDRWCWAATAEIIMRSYSDGHTPWKQCIQADDAHPTKSWPRTCCDYPYAPACNQTGWPHFEFYGFDYNRTAEPLDWKDLTDQIDQNKPVAVAVRYTDPDDPSITNGGHMGVVAGYVVSDGEKKILIVDPDGFHGGMWALYDDIFGNSSNTVHHWRTYYDIRPLPPSP